MPYKDPEKERACGRRRYERITAEVNVPSGRGECRPFDGALHAYSDGSEILAVECAFPIPSQGPEPDIFFRLVVLPVAVVAPAPLGGSDMDPARCPVHGAGVARSLDEGLDQHGGGVVALGPVLGQAAADDGEDVRAEVGDFDPGQDQEPRVVDHQGEVLLAQLRRPPDELVARGELPRGGAEAEHGDGPAVAVVDGVAHLGADQGLVSEIVVAGDELVPELPFPGAAHDGAQVERTDLVEGCRGREQRRLGVRVRRRSAWAGPAVPWAAAGRSHRRGAWPAW